MHRSIVLGASRFLFLAYFLFVLWKLRSQLGAAAQIRMKRLAALKSIFPGDQWKSDLETADVETILRFRRNVRVALLCFGASQLLAFGAARAVLHYWVFDRIW